MSVQTFVLLPRYSRVADSGKMAHRIHQFLLEQNIIKPKLRKGIGCFAKAYPLAAGFVQVLSQDGLDFIHQFEGVCFETERRIFDPGEDGGIRSIRCPFCHHVIVGEPEATEENYIEYNDCCDENAYEWVNLWQEGQDVFSCPACLKAADINEFLVLPQWGFSNFAMIFGGGYPDMFQQSFLDELAQRIGYELVQVCNYS